MERINGRIVPDQPYVYQSAEIDISGASATLDVVWVPKTTTIHEAHYIVTEAFGTMDTGAIQIGYGNADGGGDTDDYFVIGTTDEANGLLQSSEAVGSVVELTLVKSSLAAGKLLTISHLTDATIAGKVRVIIKYSW
ncbi:MAG: hypothetical protein E3J56_11060 [Candidatus Aminicenantes bacterium]|nr:MAG: hypothetical protein E3J56_11060 [Candidatus Aminicenantes bacterium]